mmetsp:Transcript_11613/g.17857  ORF Transcript_11613/g.17857 Transcript_11613/m.17857 type:complete len:85 (-) Transcript_11613:115-369(-)
MYSKDFRTWVSPPATAAALETYCNRGDNAGYWGHFKVLITNRPSALLGLSSVSGQDKMRQQPLKASTKPDEGQCTSWGAKSFPS